MEVTEDTVRFRSHGEGQRGFHDYEFALRLFGKVVPEEAVHKVAGGHVDLILPKAPLKGDGDVWWPSAQEGTLPSGDWVVIGLSTGVDTREEAQLAQDGLQQVGGEGERRGGRGPRRRPGGGLER